MKKLKLTSEEEKKLAEEKQGAMVEALADAYATKLEDGMGQLHNQFVVFISSAKIPLPNVMLVLEMLKKEIVDQAFGKYLGE